MKGKSLVAVFEGRQWPLLLGLVLAGSALYLGWARWQTGGFGYPLDDAWIHQVFARSIALRGEISFNPSELSAGSTSPLWTLLLSLGYLLPTGYFTWSMILGVASLFLCGLLAARLARLALPTAPAYLSLTAGALTVTIWYLVWTALSGIRLDYVVRFTGNSREKLPALPLETVLSNGVDVPTHFGGDLVTVYRMAARP